MELGRQEIAPFVDHMNYKNVIFESLVHSVSVLGLPRHQFLQKGDRYGAVGFFELCEVHIALVVFVEGLIIILSFEGIFSFQPKLY